MTSYKVCLYFFWYQWTRKGHSYPLVPHTWCFVNRFPRSWGGGGIRPPRLWDGSKKPGSFSVNDERQVHNVNGAPRGGQGGAVACTFGATFRRAQNKVLQHVLHIESVSFIATAWSFASKTRGVIVTASCPLSVPGPEARGASFLFQAQQPLYTTEQYHSEVFFCLFVLFFVLLYIDLFVYLF